MTVPCKAQDFDDPSALVTTMTDKPTLSQHVKHALLISRYVHEKTCDVNRHKTTAGPHLQASGVVGSLGQPRR